MGKGDVSDFLARNVRYVEFSEKFFYVQVHGIRCSYIFTFNTTMQFTEYSSLNGIIRRFIDFGPFHRFRKQSNTQNAPDRSYSLCSYMYKYEVN